MNNLKNKELNIKELLENDNYIIPIYQRNFAWEKPEIEQLINDISNAIENDLAQYFIGTLVVFDSDNHFEIIDGQQRHTTISLIHATIQNQFESESIVKLVLQKSNLNYKARKDSRVFFDSINSDFTKTLKKDNAFTFAIKQIILPSLKRLKEQGKLEKWIEYFYEFVMFFRVEVPADTDLHHYFETMNNRGEQLEETEVLKAKFMSYISQDDKNESESFSKIWGKCSDMFSYYCENQIELEKSKSENENLGIFDLVVQTKEMIKDSIKYQELLNVPIDKTQSRSEIKFNSIMNFPNFLLIVLKLKDEKVSLNEKNLLKEFGYFNEKLVIDSLVFISHLEKCRKLFDIYFIKRNFEDNRPYWVLLSDGKNNTFTKDESISEDDDITTAMIPDGKELQDKLIKIQSMLQSTYFSNVNKYWLYEGMKKILKNENINNGIENVENVEIGNLLFEKLLEYSILKFEETINDEYFPKNKGLDISRITFNFVDYLLWKTYYDKVRGNQTNNFETDSLLDRINRSKGNFNKFIFKQNSSIEHYYPQNPEKTEDKMTDEQILNSFGNLCLISRSTNSRYSNFMPTTKRNEKLKNIESLKQAIMFSYADWDKDGTEIDDHQKQICQLIKDSINL